VIKLVAFLAPCSSLLVSGCLGLPDWGLFKGPPAPPGPVESLVLRGDRLEKDPGPLGKVGKTAGELEGGKELLRRGENAQAEKIFHRVANDTKNSIQIAEEARYYEAESLRLQGHYPKAADTYSKLLKDFPSGQYREQASQRLFDIANYWLEDTRAEMKADSDKDHGKKWLVMPASYVHFEKGKPFLDEEGWAVEKLEEIKTDLTCPLADKALFYLGTIKYYRKDYREADQHFTQLTETQPNSPLAPKALKMAIICKQLSTGGSDYDGRKAAEARKLIHTAQAAYQQFAKDEKEFLQKQIVSINLQQASKEFKMAEYFRKTGYPGSAYFYYELVRRRYPNLEPYYSKATERVNEIKARLEKENRKPPEVPGEGGFWSKLKLPTRQEKPEQAPPPRPLVPGTPLTTPETAPAPRLLPPEVSGNK
jgi:TolA-binding protein